MGYYISTNSFSGPFFPVDMIRSGRAFVQQGPEIANLFCVKKQLLGPGGSMHMVKITEITKGSLTNDVMTRPEVAAAAAAARAAVGGQLQGAGRR
jgi:hypothetical protein